MKNNTYHTLQLVITATILNSLLQRIEYAVNAPVSAEQKVENISAILADFSGHKSDVFDKYEIIRRNIDAADAIAQRLLEELEASA